MRINIPEVEEITKHSVALNVGPGEVNSVTFVMGARRTHGQLEQNVTLTS